MVPFIWATSPSPSDPAWQLSPIVHGEIPRTLQALRDECNEFIQKVHSRGYGTGYAHQLAMRWWEAMGNLSSAERPLFPKIEEHQKVYGQVGATRGFFGPGQHVATGREHIPGRLAEYARRVKEWCDARMGDGESAARRPKKRDKKSDKRKRISKKRPINAKAARCIVLFKKAKRKDPSTRMKHVVEDYAVEHECSGLSIMRVLNDHPELWKAEKDDKKATKRRH